MTALLLVLLVVLILLNGFFVAAEFALVRARRSRMEEEAKEGSRSALRALHQMDHLSEYLSAAQVGITMTSIGLGFLGEPAVATLLEPVFGEVMSHGVSVVISVALAYLLVTSAHVIVGEQAPKMTAITHAETHRALVRAATGVVPGGAPSRDLGAQQCLELRRQANPADRRRERQRGREPHRSCAS